MGVEGGMAISAPLAVLRHRQRCRERETKSACAGISPPLWCRSSSACDLLRLGSLIGMCSLNRMCSLSTECVLLPDAAWVGCYLFVCVCVCVCVCVADSAPHLPSILAAQYKRQVFLKKIYMIFFNILVDIFSPRGSYDRFLSLPVPFSLSLCMCVCVCAVQTTGFCPCLCCANLYSFSPHECVCACVRVCVHVFDVAHDFILWFVGI